MAYTISELAKKAQNVEELIVLAKENGMELFLKLTSDINKKNELDNSIASDIFKRKSSDSIVHTYFHSIDNLNFLSCFWFFSSNAWFM